jgi:hypothetical protein
MIRRACRRDLNVPRAYQEADVEAPCRSSANVLVPSPRIAQLVVPNFVDCVRSSRYPEPCRRVGNAVAQSLNGPKKRNLIERNAMREIVIQATHQAGELARIANALSLKDVNIKSVAALAIGHQGLVRIIPDDIESARRGLQDANIRFEEKEVVTVLLENKAGELTGIAAKLADAGINLDAAYVVGLAGDMVELALAVNDVKKAKKLLE